jgi:malonyl-CoA/methylmalonyl-CoA synthetase
VISLIAKAEEFTENMAISTPDRHYTYQDLLQASAQIAAILLNASQDLDRQRVAFLIPSGFEYVATLWGIWRSGGIAVPMCVVHPAPELEYVILNSGSTIVIAHPDFAEILEAIAQKYNLRFISTTEFISNKEICDLPNIEISQPALILYTSGTTGKPKGVVLTHANIQAQVPSLVTAWEWDASDRILHVLPLHHIHGIVNVLLCALWVGAECYTIAKFDSEIVWDCICNGHLSLFMAVPTIYVKLINSWEKASPQRRQEISKSCARLRLMVSGSAALPVQVLEKWRDITGHFLLERYGMTEIGMALSNPLRGDRRAGSVGTPLPNVEVRLAMELAREVVQAKEEPTGEIQVKGAGVFKEYWGNPEATAKAFTDGWFHTGDLAVIEAGRYRILGRISVDMIKTGGYKVSALEIEETLRNHPEIQECAVVGVEDCEWGERVCAALVLKSPESELTLSTLRSWSKQHLAVYKVPTQILILSDLPRNPMGKVIKPNIVKLFSISSPTSS